MRPKKGKTLWQNFNALKNSIFQWWSITYSVTLRDPMHCKKGDSFITKPAAKNNTVEQPRM